MILNRERDTSEPVRVPTLDELAENPAAFDHLPPAAQAAQFERAEVLAAHLRARILTARVPAAPPSPAAPDRAVGLKEASGLLSMSKDYLWRHWQKLGGYKDRDGRIKFPLSTIQRLVRGRR